MRNIYHQKQYQNYCRLHAVNNLLGYQKFSFEEFNKKCDEFDKKNNFVIGFSRRTCAFYNNGNEDNIFGYLLGNQFTMEYFNNQNINKDKLIGFICFNNNHTWCIRYFNNSYYLIDSLKNNINLINLNLISNLKCFKFIIYKKFSNEL